MKLKLDKMTVGFAIKALSKLILIGGMVYGGEMLVTDAINQVKTTLIDVFTAFVPFSFGLLLDWVGSYIKSKRKIVP